MGTGFKTFPFFDSIGFSIETIWYRKKVLYSAPFRFWVSSHTDPVSFCPRVSSARCRPESSVRMIDGYCCTYADCQGCKQSPKFATGFEDFKKAKTTQNSLSSLACVYTHVYWAGIYLVHDEHASVIFFAHLHCTDRFDLPKNSVLLFFWLKNGRLVIFAIRLSCYWTILKMDIFVL